jgi:hypothetical protein
VIACEIVEHVALIPGHSGELAPGNPPTARALSDPSHYADLRRGAREVASRFTLSAHVLSRNGEETIHA